MCSSTGRLAQQFPKTKFPSSKFMAFTHLLQYWATCLCLTIAFKLASSLISSNKSRLARKLDSFYLVEAKEEVVGDILKFEMSNRRSTLFMIKKKYPDLDLSDVDLTQMEGYNISDLANGSELIGDLNVGGATQGATDQTIEEEIRVEGTENIDAYPHPLGTKSNVNPLVNEEDPVNVPSDQNN